MYRTGTVLKDETPKIWFAPPPAPGNGRRKELSHRKPARTSAVSGSVDDEQKRRWIMKIRIAAPLLLTALAAPAIATDYTDSAPEVSSVTVYPTVNEPRQQCWTESITTYEQRRSPGGAILGGLTGGPDGNPNCG